MPEGYYDISWRIEGTGYIQHADGEVASSSNSSHTDYIDISRFDSIAYKRQGATQASPNAGIAFYDSEKTYKSPGIPSVASQPSAGYVSSLNVVDVPSGVQFVRCSTYTDTATYGVFEIYGLIGGETYAVSRANLMSVGDEIRAKGKTTASLSFPTGFISAIRAIPSGIGTLLQTTSLGTVSTSSTSAVDMEKTVSVSNVDAYDALLVETSVDTVVNGRHTCTCAWIWLTATTSVSEKSGATIATAKQNMKISSGGVTTVRASTTAYGVYPNACTISDGDASLDMYMRYHSTQTGTINNDYTTRVYGLKLFDLIGG